MSWLRPTRPVVAYDTPVRPTTGCCPVFDANGFQHTLTCRDARDSANEARWSGEPVERFPIRAPRGPLITDPAWTHLNEGGGRG